MSLHSKLNNWIEQQKFVTFNDMERFCKDNSFKISNGERQLRPSLSPNVKAVKNPSGAIVGYRHITYNNQPTCCFSFRTFSTHDPQCPQLEKVTNALF